MIRKNRIIGKTIGSTKTLSALGLLNGALVWGLIWYPMRILQDAGISAELTSLLIYLLALALGSVAFASAYRDFRSHARALVLLGFSAGWANLAYGLAVVHGEVMRVLLLFYLAPLWTVILARLLLGEVLTRYGYLVIGLSLAGALTMLKEPAVIFPVPQNAAEWLGLSAGLAFAWTNVLARQHANLPLAAKSIAVWWGVALLAAAAVALNPAQSAVLSGATPQHWTWLAVMGFAVWLATLTVQYGLRGLPANQAIVILLFELVVAALSSYFLANESLSTREWLGAAMIVAASLFSGKLEAKPD